MDRFSRARRLLDRLGPRGRRTTGWTLLGLLSAPIAALELTGNWLAVRAAATTGTLVVAGGTVTAGLLVVWCTRWVTSQQAGWRLRAAALGLPLAGLLLELLALAVLLLGGVGLAALSAGMALATWLTPEPARQGRKTGIPRR